MSVLGGTQVAQAELLEVVRGRLDVVLTRYYVCICDLGVAQYSTPISNCQSKEKGDSN
jgi:hypothetical protein